MLRHPTLRPTILRRERSRLWEKEGPTAPLAPFTATLIVINFGLAASFRPLLPPSLFGTRKHRHGPPRLSAVSRVLQPRSYQLPQMPHKPVSSLLGPSLRPSPGMVPS